MTFTALPFDRLTELLGSRARASAARRWLYGGPPPAALPERIPGVTPAAWDAVRQAAPLPAWRVVRRQRSADGTVKYALDFAGATVETVLIPGRGRSTVCVSSQAGCSRSCTFCATATLGLARGLDAGEIVLQYAIASAEAAPDAPARNVVFMGMGEPMDNLDAVMVAVDRLLERPRPGLAAGHVTVSTSGVLPGMKRFLREGRGNLALSLNATTDAQRMALMPHTRTWPIRALLGALREDQARRPDRRYFIEYVLWAGINDSDADATRLVELLRGLNAHVNLIPHNVGNSGGRGEKRPPARFALPPIRSLAQSARSLAESELRPPSDETVTRFQRRVAAARVRCIVRWPRGRDIAAACGQLAGPRPEA